MTLRIPFDNSYARLPERFFDRRAPTPVASPQAIEINVELARELGIEPPSLDTEDGVAMLAGNLVAEGAEPIALAYAGHQFGHFVPQLGDGRAILMGEVVDATGRRFDLQWKGSGRTAFSRGGDGRAALGPVLRETLVSEAMHALGVPTTRTLGAVSSGEWVARETQLPGAVLVRVASSHLRVGTFQYFAARGDLEGVRLLADYALMRHPVDAAPSPHRALLESVIARQAALVAKWLGLGFIHGVMNTDNMTISGETIDYGPCAFLDAYHPSKVFSSIDRGGRYAYSNQPRIAGWNLARLAETLLPLLGDTKSSQIDAAQAALDGFGREFDRAYRRVFADKLGLAELHDSDDELLEELLACMADAAADFTITFRTLCDAASDETVDVRLREQFGSARIVEWLVRWRQRLAHDPPKAAGAREARMRLANPAYIPRNHQIEAAIVAATAGDLLPFRELARVLRRPYEEQPGMERFAAAPRPEEVVTRTFCGT